MKQRICLLSSYPSTTGVGRYSNNLYETGFYESFFYFKFQNKVKRTNENVENYRIITPRFVPGNIYYAYSFFSKSIWSKTVSKYDFAHVTSPEFFHISKFEPNMIGTIHDMYYTQKETMDSYGKIYRKALQMDMNFSNRLLGLTAVSKTTSTAFREFFPNIKCRVIHNWTSDVFRKIDKDLARSKLNLPRSKFIIMNVSSESPEKNRYFLSKVLESIADDFLFINICKGKMHLHNESKIYNITELIDDETLCLYYNSADIYIAPSLAEGFNFPVIEAINCGVPVIASDIEIFREVLRNSPYLLKLNDLDLWKTLLTEMIQYRRSLLEAQIWYENEIGNYYRAERGKAEIEDFYQSIGILS